MNFIQEVLDKLKTYFQTIKDNAAQKDAWRTGVDPALLQFYDYWSSYNGKLPDVSFPHANDEFWANYQQLAQQGDYIGLQGLLGSAGTKGLDANFMSYLNNQISQQQVDTANEYTAGREDSALLRQAEQLAALGLGSSGVLSIGGAGSSPSKVAETDRSGAQYAIQEKMAKTRFLSSLTRGLIGLATGLGSAGIYGSAINRTKEAASNVARTVASTAHGLLDDMRKASYHARFVRGKFDGGTTSWDDMINSLEADYKETNDYSDFF